MTSTIVDPEVLDAVDGVRVAIDRLAGLDLDAAAGDDVIALLEAHEQQVRRMAAVGVAVIDTIDQRGLYSVDGHYSAKIMARHLLKLSGGEAAGRARAAKALRDLPGAKKAWEQGRIGTCQVNRLARAHANVRVRNALVDVEAHFVTVAESVSYKRFDQHVTDFVRRADEDGTCDSNDRNHHNRNARWTQDYNLGWQLSAHCASLQGAALHDIFEAFVAAELEADWEKARAQHGDTALAEHLPRTDNQRRFDALWQIFQQGTTSQPGTRAGGSEVVTNIVIDTNTFDRMLTKLSGTRTPAPDPADDDYRCSTIDGYPVEPTETVANALVGHVRRVVMGSDGVVIDLGRKQRLFTGSARLAVFLQNDECFWPGCHVPVSACQADHTKPTAQGGCTCPGNGAPACGRHNRLKEHGYIVWRDPTGQWHTHRPDGTEIT